MRLVFISSVIATTVLRMTSAVKASTVAFIGIFSSFIDYYLNDGHRLNYLNRVLRSRRLARPNRSIPPAGQALGGHSPLLACIIELPYPLAPTGWEGSLGR